MAGEIKDPYFLLSKKLCKYKNGPEYGYIGDIYAGGTYYVYNVCNDPGCTIINPILAKIYPLDKHNKEPEEVHKEVNYMLKGFELGVTPDIISLLECEYDSKQYAIILMEKYGDGTLTDLLTTPLYNEFKRDIHLQLKTILDILYANNISHNDLHSDNFLFKFHRDLSNNILFDIPPEIKIIDFDVATPNKGPFNYKIEDRNIYSILPTIKNMKDKIKLMRESMIDVR